MKKQEPIMCLVCGHFTSDPKRCVLCLRPRRGFGFLARLPKHKGRVTLRCPQVSPHFSKDKKQWARCPGKLHFPLSAFEMNVGAAGNGFNSFLLGVRFKLSGDCPRCKIRWNAEELIRNNERALKIYARRRGI